MRLEAGSVVLLPFPYTNLQAGKKRPALVLTDDEYNAGSPDVVLAFVTSRRQTSEWSLPISGKDLVAGRLVKDSWIRVDRLATVEQGLVLGVVGRLKPTVFKRVRRLVVELLG